MESPCLGRSLCHRGGWTGEGPRLAPEKAVGSARVMRGESEQPEGGVTSGPWGFGRQKEVVSASLSVEQWEAG